MPSEDFAGVRNIVVTLGADKKAPLRVLISVCGETKEVCFGGGESMFWAVGLFLDLFCLL